ncbi:unnamed protein product [Rotaria magnacalcarata]|uniref:Uncharacterized protein n=2 Tax=Rotaria magnacalcarata TaxID=392030 RepID=A0A815E7K0_9BILA|nr:unnamed protein product [Rotaria magnacalcarata]CAF1674846.1 unnamed protein product [Rotaria magnacalcarata]CAF1917357.1 unnamed protein product [Rotaria magnacalcarata]CAF2128379.1 unnamed protein product [Rotaria magnacalcarata]CAF2197230.1 unnamed protein product [Rotaria magnacalcarata]
MSAYFLSTFGFIAFLLLATFVSCSPVFVQEDDDMSTDHSDQHLRKTESDEEAIKMVMPKIISFLRDERPTIFYPRVHRNAWYRVSTYQHLQPPISEETSDGNSVMRWGRK